MKFLRETFYVGVDCSGMKNKNKYLSLVAKTMLKNRKEIPGLIRESVFCAVQGKDNWVETETIDIPEKKHNIKRIK